MSLRAEGIRRRQELALRLQDAECRDINGRAQVHDAEMTVRRPLSSRRSLEESALHAEEIRMGWHQPPAKFTAESIQEKPNLPERLQIGWERDAEAYGWFGGSISQTDYMAAQQAKIAQLAQERNNAIRMAAHMQHLATANKHQRQHDAQPATPRPSSPRTHSPRRPVSPRAGTTTAAPTSPSSPAPPRPSTPRAGSPTPPRPATSASSPPPPRQATPSHAAGRTTPPHGRPTAPEGAAAVAADLEAAAESLRAMHLKVAALSRELAAEQTRRRAADETIARERIASTAALEKAEKEVASARKAAAKAQAEMLRLRTERDELEWLLKRVKEPPARLDLCHMCGASGMQFL